MNIEELNLAKRAMEDEILRAIHKFQELSGYCPRFISLNTMETMNLNSTKPRRVVNSIKALVDI